MSNKDLIKGDYRVGYEKCVQVYKDNENLLYPVTLWFIDKLGCNADRVYLPYPLIEAFVDTIYYKLPRGIKQLTEDEIMKFINKNREQFQQYINDFENQFQQEVDKQENGIINELLEKLK